MRLVISMLAVVALTVGGVATAANGRGTTERPRAAKVHRGLVDAAASYLGLTRTRLAAELRSGKSLAQVASARGKSVDGLKSVLLIALKAKIDAAVAAGQLDASRAQRLLQRAPAHIDRLVQRVGSRGHARPARTGKASLLRAAATYIGVTRHQLVAELREGKSLAQVAASHGRSVDGLKAALLAALKAKVDAAVAAGRLDGSRAQRVLEHAPARIDRLIARVHGSRP